MNVEEEGEGTAHTSAFWTCGTYHASNFELKSTQILTAQYELPLRRARGKNL